MRLYQNRLIIKILTQMIKKRSGCNFCVDLCMLKTNLNFIF